MFDTMTMTKVAGGLLGALLIFLLGNWAADTLYSTEVGGHGDEAHAPGYHIETGGDEGPAEDTMVDEVAFADVLASADAAKGEKVFSKCKACHKLEAGANSTGPSLYGVVDRQVGSIGDFSYSSAVADLGGTWDAETLNSFLESPKAVAPGTKMTFTGLKKVEDRANLIAYLATIGG